jgi:hypothetical protein
MTTQQPAVDPLDVERVKAALSLELENEKARLQLELEREKHRLTVQREADARLARHAEVVYQELGQHMRSLNTFLWQVPGLVIAITGGLWFGAASIDNLLAKRVALGFTALVDVLMIAVVVRMRILFQRNLTYQTKYEGKTPDGPAAASTLKYLVVGSWCVLLAAGALISICGAWLPELVRRSDPTPVGAVQRVSNHEDPPIRNGQPASDAKSTTVKERTGAQGQTTAVDVRTGATPPGPADPSSVGTPRK